jgi:hypothetical protein
MPNRQMKHQYTDTKEKLYKTNAAIWYNKICREKQLTPDYIPIKINGKKFTMPENNKNCHPINILTTLYTYTGPGVA